MITQFIEFNIRKDSYISITAKQGDINSRYVEFHLLDDSLPFSLVGKTVKCFIEKPDKHLIFNDLEITNAELGYCILELTSQTLAVPGLAKIEIVIYSDGKKLSTIPIKMNIVKSINSDEAIESADEFGSLEALIWKIDGFEQDIKSKATKVELDALEYNINTKITNINNDIGTAILNTTNKTIKGAINEVYKAAQIPIGEIRNFVSAPDSNWVRCDGSPLSKNEYPEYYAQLGNPPLGPSITAGDDNLISEWTDYDIKFASAPDCIYAVKHGLNSFGDMYLYRSVDGITWTTVGTTGRITPSFKAGNPYVVEIFYADKIGLCIFASYLSDSGYNALGYLNSNDTFTWKNMASSGLYNVGHTVGVVDGLPVILSANTQKYYTLNSSKTITASTSPLTFPNLQKVHSYGDRIIGLDFSNSTWIVYYNNFQSSMSYKPSSTKPYVYNYIRYYNGKYYAQLSNSQYSSGSDVFLYESTDFVNWILSPAMSSLTCYSYGYLPEVNKYFFQPDPSQFNRLYISDRPDFTTYDTIVQNEFNLPEFEEEPDMVSKYDKVIYMSPGTGRTGVCRYINAKFLNADQFSNIKLDNEYAYVKVK